MLLSLPTYSYFLVLREKVWPFFVVCKSHLRKTFTSVILHEVLGHYTNGCKFDFLDVTPCILVAISVIDGVLFSSWPPWPRRLQVAMELCKSVTRLYSLCNRWRIFIVIIKRHTCLQNPSWEANRLSASQEIFRKLRNRKAHYRVYKCPSPALILRHINPVHVPIPLSENPSYYYPPIYAWVFSSGLFPSGFPTKILYTLILSPIRATCPIHPILFNFITQIVFGEEYRSLSLSLCSFLNSPVTSSLLGLNIILSTLFFKNPQPPFLPQCGRPSFTPIQNRRQNYSSVYLNLYIFG